jgi:uncharacterized protein (TIGR03083 family)
VFDPSTARRITARELASMLSVAGSLESADWARPTRCGAWTVRQVCSHAGLTAIQQAEAFRRALEGVLEPPDHPGAPELSEDDVLALLHDGAVALDEAMADLDDVALAGMAPLPFGVVPTVVAMQVAVYEYAFHADDLRAATARTESFPADIASAFVGFFPGLAGMLAARAEPGSPTHAYRLVAPAGTIDLAFVDNAWAPDRVELSAPLCEISGDDDVIALFTMGRISADDERLQVHGPRSAAAEFKRWFPGP